MADQGEMMAIEFSKGRLSKGIACRCTDRGLMAVIEPELTMSAYDELTIADLEQILSKMKELQGEKV